MSTSATSSAARRNRPPQIFGAATFIAKNLPLESVPGVPEIRLRTATPASGLRRLAERDAHFGSPYWAYPWAGGIGLARYVLDHPQVIEGRRVLDLGTGSGLVAIAAAKAGARAVLASDIDRYAIAAAALNANANDVIVTLMHGDLTETTLADIDLVLVGDLFYAQGLAARVTGFLNRCREAGIEALVGDPRRAWLPSERLREIATYQVRDFGDGQTGGTTASAVYAFDYCAGGVAGACELAAIGSGAALTA